MGLLSAQNVTRKRVALVALVALGLMMAKLITAQRRITND